MDYWLDDYYGNNFIFYYEYNPTYYWLIGPDLGEFSAGIFTKSDTINKKCPNNEGHVWNWFYNVGDGGIASNDIYIKCANEDDFCSSENPCGTDNGDCDTHDECQVGLYCGSNNCPSSLGFHSEFDCCYVPAVGDEHFCTTSNPCAENEGDCDTHDECQTGLSCGAKNCPTSLGFGSEIDCCYVSTICGNMAAINSLKNSDSATVAGWNFDLDRGPWNFDVSALGNSGSCGDAPWFGWKDAEEVGIISTTLYGTGTASITFGNCWVTGEVKLVIDGNVISSAGPNSLKTSEFQFEDSNIKLEEHNTAIIRFDDFEIPNCVARKKDIQNDDKILFRYPTPNIPRKHRTIPKHHNKFEWEEESLLYPQYRKKLMKKSRSKRNTTQHKATIRKTNTDQLSQLKSNCEGRETTYKNTSIVCNHLASSVEGLIVKLNPNVEEYKTDAIKNNFIGFKYLVHSPYDFPYVETVGKAMGPNIQSYIGFLGFHAWITDNADAYTPIQKNCASKHDIELDVYQDYTRANCVFECQAKSIFQNCGCLPYQYPEFHLVTTGIWENVTSTACNYTQLTCLSRVKGI